MIEGVSTCEHRQSRQRGWPRALRIGASRIAMRAAMMRGIVVARMVMVMPGRRHLCIAQDIDEMSIHRREHESGGNERAQEQQPEDDECRPMRLFNVPHPFHRREVFRNYGLIISAGAEECQPEPPIGIGLVCVN
jgi:hypothetical protein